MVQDASAYSVNYNDPAQYLNTYGNSGFCFPYSYRFDQIVRAGTTGSSFRIELGYGDG